MAKLWERKQWVTDIPIILNNNIYEYDIKAANVNMLYAYGIITEDAYYNYLNMDKKIREVSIGLMQKNQKKQDGTNTIGQMINDGIKECKRLLFEANNIDDANVVRVASDAVYVMSEYPCPVTTVMLNNHPIVFKVNGPYRSMLKLGNLVIFFALLENGYDVSVKGINDNLVHLHSDFLSFLCQIIDCMEHGDRDGTLRIYKDYYNAYIHRELPINHYREFNSSSSFRLINSTIGPRFIDQSMMNLIDISYNNYILRELYRIILTN